MLYTPVSLPSGADTTGLMLSMVSIMYGSSKMVDHSSTAQRLISCFNAFLCIYPISYLGGGYSIFATTLPTYTPYP